MLCARYLGQDSHRNLLLFSQFQSRKKLLLSFLCARGVGERVCSVACAHVEPRDQLQVSPSTALRFRRHGLPHHLELASLEPGWPASTQTHFSACTAPRVTDTRLKSTDPQQRLCTRLKGEHDTYPATCHGTRSAFPGKDTENFREAWKLRPHGQGYCLLWEIRVESFRVTEQTHIKNLLFIHAFE